LISGVTIVPLLIHRVVQPGKVVPSGCPNEIGIDQFLIIKAETNMRARSRADNSFDRELRSFIGPDLLIVDDFALKKLSSQATSDFYDLLIERHTRSSTILTSDRSVEEWMAVFDDPMLGQSALDRFCHRAHQFVIEGESYRKRTAPGSKTTPKTGGKSTT